MEVTMNKLVSVITEIPEELYESLKGYLDKHSSWDQDRVFTAALSGFLLHNRVEKSRGETQCTLVDYDDWKCAQIYLEANFQ
jgi:Protein of unknown function (DUF2811)